MILDTLYDQKKSWIIIEFFRANSFDLEYFVLLYKKLTFGVFSPLKFCQGMQIFIQNPKMTTNMELFRISEKCI